MKREKTYHGYYRRIREHDKKRRYLVGGISLVTMSDMKYYEYKDLLQYLHFGWKPKYGYCIAEYRFYKNMKYRKTFIRLINKIKAE